MNDDEIDAILIPELARYLECEHGDLPVTECERIAYRAGMLRAARIARSARIKLGDYGWEVIHNGAIEVVADAIERAAGGEG